MKFMPKTLSKWINDLIDGWNKKDGTTLATNISIFKTKLDLSDINLNIPYGSNSTSLEKTIQLIEESSNNFKEHTHNMMKNSIPYEDMNYDIIQNTESRIILNNTFVNFVANNMFARKCIFLIMTHKDNEIIPKLFQLLFRYYLTHLVDFTKLLKHLDKAEWLYPLLRVILSELQRISLAADNWGKNNGNFRVDHPSSQKFIESITDLYRLTLSDTRYGSSGNKIFPMLPSVTMLIRLYFRISNIQLCGPVITSILRSQSNNNFTQTDLNTFNFYAGKKAMFNGDVDSAVKFLKEAFESCPNEYINNKRLILIYLIPIHMLLGIIPKKLFLEQYSLEPFIPLSHSIKVGNLKLYHSTMEKYKLFFVKHGIYVVLLKVEFITLRSLLKYVFDYTESYNLSLDVVHTAYNLSFGKTVSKSRFESVLSSLIYNGYIQGTILSEHQRLMVSKSKPFPQLSV